MKEFFTTGEAARILGLSLSTVCRYFDGQKKKGKMLSGMKNPFTGRRRVSRVSIVQLARIYNVKIQIERAGEKTNRLVC